MVSTAADLDRWLAALREGRIVSPATWERMIADTTGETSCGWTRGRPGWGTRVVTSGGDWDGYKTDIYWFPDDSLTVILATNVAPNTFTRNASALRAVVRVVRGRPTLMPPPVAALDSAALRPYSGRYRLESGAGFEVSRKGHVLHVGAAGQEAVNLLVWPGLAPPAPLGACNARADSVVTALETGDSTFVARVVETPEIAMSVRDWWREHVSAPGGAVRHRAGLGTAPKGPSRLESFVRGATGQPEPVVVRLVWRVGTLELTAIGSGIPFPAATLFLPEGGGRFAAYDPPTDQVVRIAFGRGERGDVAGLSVLRSSGEKVVEARRVR